MRWLPPLLIGCLLCIAGCRSSCDKVEAALRTTEESLREARAKLQTQGTYTSALEHELRILRGEVYTGTPGKPVAIYPIRSVVLGRQTGGHDSPNGQGDDGLQVIIEPQDAEGKALQVPGEAMLQVLEVSQEGHKRVLSTWYIDKDQIKASWRVGLIAQGYNLILPWKVVPCTEKLRILLQFRLEDGRLFEADRDITVRLPKGMQPKTSTTVISSNPPVLPAPKTETAPMPLPVPAPAPTPTPGPKSPERPMPLPTPTTAAPSSPLPPPNSIPGPKLTPMPAPATLPMPRSGDGPSLGTQSRLDSRVQPAAVLGKPAREP